MSEECCHRIGELLASLSNIPESNVTAKFDVFEEILKLLAKEIQSLQKWTVDADEVLEDMPMKKAVSVEELEKEG